MLKFSERIRRRKQIWWAPGGLRNPNAWQRPIHSVLDTHQLRHRDWPEARWHCCQNWQRCLSNKWNSRQFALMHGVSVPDLYWHGRDLSRFPVHDLPSRFALRFAWGAGSDQTHLLIDGRELLDDRPCTPQELHARLLKQYGRWTIHPLLMEEFLEDPSGKPRASQFNFYCFAGYVGIVEHVEHAGRSSKRTAYNLEWQPFPEGVWSGRQQAEVIPPPAAMTRMLEVASRLGAAYEGFVRIDLYQCTKGVYFGEFSSTPFNGMGIRPWADSLLGQLWQEHCSVSI